MKYQNQGTYLNFRYVNKQKFYHFYKVEINFKILCLPAFRLMRSLISPDVCDPASRIADNISLSSSGVKNPFSVFIACGRKESVEFGNEQVRRM